MKFITTFRIGFFFLFFSINIYEAVAEITSGSAVSSSTTGFDFSGQQTAGLEDDGGYLPDFVFVSNEGVNFGNEGSTSLSGTGNRFLQIGTGTLNDITSVTEYTGSSPWVSVSYDATGYQPISVGELWAVYTREGHYAVMEITAVPDDFGTEFSFDYKYQPDGTTAFDGGGGDVTAPGFTELFASAVTETSIEVSYDIDEQSTLYYLVVLDGSAIPTVEQVVNPGTYGDEPNLVLSGSVGSATAGGITVNDLTASTTYDLYFVAVDGSDYESVLGSILDVSTSAASPEPTITITSPTSSTNVTDPGSIPIGWTIQNISSGNVGIEYSIDGGDNWSFQFSRLYNLGSVNWQAPDLATGISSSEVILRIYWNNDRTVLDEVTFTINSTNPRTLEITSPLASTLTANDEISISYDFENWGASDYIATSYSLDGETYNGISGLVQTGATSGTESATWTVVGIPSSTFYLKAQGYNDNNVFVDEIGPLTIEAPDPWAYNITYPNGGESLSLNEQVTVTWDNLNFPETVPSGFNQAYLEYSTDGGDTYNYPGEEPSSLSISGASGSTTWTPTVESDSYKLRLRSNNSLIIGETDIFSVGVDDGSLTVTAPNASSKVAVYENLEITWDPGSAGATVNILLSGDGGDNFVTLASSEANDGSYTYSTTLTEPWSQSAIVRIEDASDVNTFDDSEPFELNPLNVYLPQSEYEPGTGTNNIFLQLANLAFGSVDVEYSTDNGDTWTLFLDDYSSCLSGTCGIDWEVPDVATTEALIRVTSANGGWQNTSDVFTINGTSPMSITITSPTSSDVWIKGANEPISWTYEGLDPSTDRITLEYYDGTDWTAIITNGLLSSWPSHTYSAYTLNLDPSNVAQIRITVTTQTGVSDFSEEFTLRLPNAVTTPFTEDFETTSGNEDPSGIFVFSSGEWYGNLISEPGDGTLELYDIYQNANSSILISPVITGGVGAISFDAQSASSQTLNVEYSVDGGDTYTSLGSINTTSVLENYSFELNESQDVMIRFMGSFWTAAYLDNFSFEPQSGTPNFFEDFSTGIPAEWTTNNASWEDNPALGYNGEQGTVRISGGVTGNYLQTPLLTGVNEISFYYSANGAGFDGAQFEVLSSTDGVNFSQINTAGTMSTSYEAYSYTFVEEFNGYIRINSLISGDQVILVDNFGSDGSIDTNPSIAVSAPNGGEVWEAGSEQIITWTTSNIPASDNIWIELSIDGGETYSFMDDGTFGGYSGSYTWTVSQDITSQARIRITNTTQSVSDASDANFEIAEAATPAISLTTPNGGESWTAGSEHDIIWATENVDASDLIEIRLSTDGGQNYSIIVDGTFGMYNGVYAWTVPDNITTEARIEIANTTQEVSDASDANFEIAASSVVTNTNDTGTGSLRQVIANAPEATTITFDDAVEWASSPINISSTLVINKDLTIDAEGQGVRITRTSGTARVMETSGEGTDLILKGVTLSGGNFGPGAGLNVLPSTSAVLLNCTVSGNVMSNSSGGGIYVQANATLTAINSTISGNTGLHAGGILTAGSTTLVNVTVSGNTAGPLGNGSSNLGGGVYMSAGTLDMTNCTVIGNVADDNYGGIYIVAGMASIKNTISINNSTVSQPAAKDFNGPAGSLDETNSGNNLIGNSNLAATEFGPNSLINQGAAGIISTTLANNASSNGRLTHTLIDNGSAIDGGDNAFLPADTYDVDNDGDVDETVPLDGAGNDRYFGASVDIGADESPFSTDETAPVVNTLSVADKTDTEINISYTISEESDFHYLVVLDAGAQASAGNVVDPSTYSDEASIVTSGSISAAMSGILSVSGLTAETTYDLYFVAKDGSDNLSQLSALTEVPTLASPSITVTAPNGGEVWEVGSEHDIIWTTENVNENDLIEIRLSTNGGQTYSIINDGTFEMYNGVYTWAVPDNITTEARIEIANTSQQVSDASDANFEIAAASGTPTVTLTSPNGGESWEVGSEHDIIWTTENVNENDLIEIRLSTNGGQTYSIINDGTFGMYNGVYAWTVPDNVTTEAKIEIANTSQQVSDASDANFEIAAASGTATITLTSPNGGEVWEVGSEHDIIWTTENVEASDLIEIRLSTDGGQNYSIINDGTFEMYNGVYVWTVPDNITTEARIEIANTTQQVSDASDANFTIEMKEDPIAADSLALLSIYDATGGPGWERSNWGNGLRITEWQGVTVTDSRVTAVDLSSNNLTGEFPAIQSGLEALEVLDLSDNALVSLPDLTNLLALANLNVSSNQLQFGSLERNVSIEGIVYAPQGRFGRSNQIFAEEGSSYTIKREASGSANTYTWFKEDFNGNVLELQGSGTEYALDVTGFEDEGNYFAKVVNSTVPGLELVSQPDVVKVSSLERDSLSLMVLYNMLNGEEWTSEAANWQNLPITEWAGVTIDGGRVISLSLAESGIKGSLPEAILDIAKLTNIDVSGNHIDYLPDFSDMENLASLNVSANKLDFDDLEKNMAVEVITYADQAPVGQPLNDTIPRGSAYAIQVRVGGSANQYQWRLSNNVSDGDIEGATTNSYSIEAIDYENMGQYTLQVTNDLVPDLTLTSEPQQVWASANLIFSAIGADSQPLESGIGYALKDVGPNQPFDSSAVISPVSGEFIFNLVLGDYLIAVEGDKDVYMPTYYPNTFLWEEAELIELRDDRSEMLHMTAVPQPLPPLPDGGVVAGFVESDFADDTETGDEADRVQARRKVKKAGCSMRRRTRGGGGRTTQEEDVYELIAYVETNDEGEFAFGDLPDGVYRFNIQYPGIPMNPDSFVEFEIGEEGTDGKDFSLEAYVTEEGIEVIRVNELGFFRKYFKDLSVYPNPADDVLTISYAKLVSESVQAQLLDLSGNVILQQEVQKGYSRSFELDVSKLPDGMYLLNFIDPSIKEGSIIGYKIYVKH